MSLTLLTMILALQDAASPPLPAPASAAPPPGDAAGVAHKGPAAEASPQDAAAGHAPSVEELTTLVADRLGRTFQETPLLGWAILFGGILLGLIAGKILQTSLKRVGENLKSRGWIARGSIFQYAAGPASLAVIAAGVAAGFTRVVLHEAVAPVVAKCIALLYVIALGWFIYNLVDLVELGIRRITTDTTIIQLIRKALRIFLLIMFGLFVAENFFDADITAWIAGLGLAGLAVSLAAQGPIKNLFGSVTVVLDRPFGLNDRIKFGEYVGVVEVMGFRSTKLRTMNGHLVTIPNSKLIEDVVENITARPYIRREMNVTITYDTPPEKVQRALQIVRDLLAQPTMAETFNMTDFPPRVIFNDFKADSLNILVMYWYQLNVEGRDWWTFNAQAEEFNLNLLRAYNEAGISFAFPSQTVYLAGDAERQLAIRLMPNGDAALDDDRHARLS
jgi:MscS family membrane protein